MVVGRSGHGVLGILHSVAKELVQFIEVNGLMSSSEVSDFYIGVNGHQQVVTTSGKKWGKASRFMWCIVVCKFCER